MNSSSVTVVVADLNNNLVDGSVIWLRNVMRALTRREPLPRTVLLLRDVRSEDSLLFPRSLNFPGCEILDPEDLSRIDVKRLESIPADRLAHLLALIEARNGPIESVLVRGSRYAGALMASARFRERTCVYTTERPSFASTHCGTLNRDIARHAKHIFVQSEALKRYFEVYLQARVGTVTVFPPMVELEADVPAAAPDSRPAVISYAGKLDSQYCVEELVDIAPALQAAGFRVEVIGNKFNQSARDPSFVPRFRDKLAAGTVEWIAGAAHEETRQRMGQARFGYCLRDAALDNSVELSTKLLEYCAAGTPPILRRTPQHVQLFGEDYPYYANSAEEVAQLVAANARADAGYVRTVERLIEIARPFDIAHASVRLDALFARPANGASQDQAPAAARRRVVVATHDDKFLVAALDRLGRRPDIEILRDPWATSQARTAGVDLQPFEAADVVFCEWCCGQAVWWSHNKRPNQKLIVRLHRFEAFTPFPRQVDWSAVDGLIVVSDYFKQLAVTEFGVPERIVRVLPQYVDTAEFDRPKLASADFTVGLVGINAFSHKRPDRAVEYIEALLRREPRFRLRIRSRLPWEYKWVWDDRPAERDAFIALFRRCVDGPLRDRVHFDRAGPDMPEWFRGVTAILSSSETEGCHTSVAEGMASGCLPVCYAWPGASSVYGEAFVHESIDRMVEATLQAVDRMHTAEGRAAMKADAARFDIRNTVNLLEELTQ